MAVLLVAQPYFFVHFELSFFAKFLNEGFHYQVDCKLLTSIAPEITLVRVKLHIKFCIKNRARLGTILALLNLSKSVLFVYPVHCRR